MKIILIISFLFLVLGIKTYAQMNMKGMDMPVEKKVNKPIKKLLTTPSKANNMPIEKTKEQKNNEKEKPADKGMGDMKGMPMRDVTNKMEDDVTATSQMKTMKAGPPKLVHYDLYIKDTIVNYTGKRRKAIAINGTIPAPTLYFTEGDTAEIYVHNTMKHSTSIHWHGVILPNKYDGVPYLTTAPIKPGEVHLFKFPIVQNGTYWYHSHTDVQEQSGMYGALIFFKRQEEVIPQYTMVLSDWSDMRPHEIDRSLHNQTDWFGVRKNTIQSYSEAIQKGYFKTKVTNEWKRMLAMDVSDVAYDRFLINGSAQVAAPQFKKGERVKLRIVNGSASTYFWLKYAGSKITVVASDGNDVEPVDVDRLIIAVAETYDVLITVPDAMSYEFLVTPEDRTQHASLWIGKGMQMPADMLPKLKYFEGMKMMNGMMKENGNMSGMEGMQMTNQTMDMNTVMYPEIIGGEGGDTKGAKGDNNDSSSNNMQGMNMDKKNRMQDGDSSNIHMKEMSMDNKKKADKMNGMKMGNKTETGNNENHSGGGKTMVGMDMGTTDIVTLDYSMLRAPKKTTLPSWPERTFYFNLTGNMNRYVWTIDNKTVSEAKNIYIKKGENIRIVMYNNTMMRHPMHLHGHNFRVLNGQGKYAPLKNVIDIMPMETDTIEFAATESGDWFFHCHILYHMMSGMGRIFSYVDSPPNPELPNARTARRKLNQDDRHFHSMARIGLESNGTDGNAMIANTRYKLQTMWHLGMKPEHGYESETMVGRYFGRMQWWHIYAGYDYHYKKLINGTESYTSPLIAKNIFGSDVYNWFGQLSNKNNRSTGVAGVQYTLPMLVIADFRADLDGKFRFQLSREDVPVTPRLRFNFMLNTDKEYAIGFRYILTKYFSLSTHYDSDMGLGAGITITY